jgi:hypothetical protein
MEATALIMPILMPSPPADTCGGARRCWPATSGKVRARALAAAVAVAAVVVNGLACYRSLEAAEPAPGGKASVLLGDSGARPGLDLAPRHRCGCGIDCGGSCCCSRSGASPDVAVLGRRPIEPPRRVPLPTLTRTDRHDGPCVGRFPCGGGTIPPSSSPFARPVEPAALAVRGLAAAAHASTAILLASPALAAQCAPHPLDKPPRWPTRA